MSKKANIFGKKIPVFVIALIAVMGLSSAALLLYFGKITGFVTVSQGLLVDGKNMPDSDLITETWSDFTSLEEKTFVNAHSLENQADVDANINLVKDCSGTSCPEISITYTTDKTETSNANDYITDNANSLVSVDVSGTLQNLLGTGISYTANVLNSPKYAPNINIYLSDGKVIQAWGKDWTGTGSHIISFENLGTIMGYGATVNPSLGYNAATSIDGGHALPNGPGYYYTSTADLLTDFGSLSVVKVEVRAQAGAAGGQVLRVTEFNVNGNTISLPNTDSFTSITVPAGIDVTFFINSNFPKMTYPGDYTITTTVEPVIPE